MKGLIKIEELAMCIGGIMLLTYYNAAWYWYLLLLFGPDISMAGYMINNKVGAFTYNFFHHKAVAIVIFLMATFLFHDEPLQLTGIILFGHSSLDRVFGYGLKLITGFKYTHLGVIGKNKELL